MRSLIVFMAVLVLTLLGSAAITGLLMADTQEVQPVGGTTDIRYFDGLVGIGTTQAAEGLHLYNRNFLLEGYGGYELQFKNTFASAGQWNLYQSNAGDFIIFGGYPTSDTRLVIDTAGKVGIGTAPAHKLHVLNGNIHIEGNGGYELQFKNTYANSGQWGLAQHNGGYFYIYGGYPTADTRLIISNTGNVGIGTTTPADKLEVNGGLITKGPWVDARAYNGGAFNDVTINAAITAIGTDKKTLLLAPGTWTISANVTVPTNINIRFEEGAILSIGSGYTFTINGPIDAPIVQITSGSGTLSFGAGYVKEVYPQWWGFSTTASSSTNAAALLATINSGTRNIYIPAGTYSCDVVTIPSVRHNLVIEGDKGRERTVLSNPSATGNGFTFAGEADYCTLRNFVLTTSNSSTGYAIYSNQAATSPLRDLIIENVYLSGYKNGIHIEGGQNIKIIGGRQSGQGKTVVGGVGIQLGEDSGHSINLALVKNVFITSYEVGFYSKYGNPFELNGSIIGLCATGIKNTTGVPLMAPNMYFESNDTAIDNSSSGYTFWDGSLNGTGNAITTTNHRLYRQGYQSSRVVAYRNAAWSLNGGPTKVPFDSEEEDSEGNFSLVNNDFTVTPGFSGFYLIQANITFTAPSTTAQTLEVYIYKNSSAIPATGGAFHSTLAGEFGGMVSRVVWLNGGDVIDVRAKTSANLAIAKGRIDVINLGW